MKQMEFLDLNQAISKEFSKFLDKGPTPVWFHSQQETQDLSDRS